MIYVMDNTVNYPPKSQNFRGIKKAVTSFNPLSAGTQRRFSVAVYVRYVRSVMRQIVIVKFMTLKYN